MRKTAILIGGLVFVLALSLTSLTAQDIGDNFIIIVPAGKLTLYRQDMVVKGPPKAAVKVGNCGPGTAQFQDVEIVDRGPTPAKGRVERSTNLTPTVTTEAALILPGAKGFKDMQTGWRLSSWHVGGKCGPGYEVYTAFIVAKQ